MDKGALNGQGCHQWTRVPSMDKGALNEQEEIVQLGLKQKEEQNTP